MTYKCKREITVIEMEREMDGCTKRQNGKERKKRKTTKNRGHKQVYPVLRLFLSKGTHRLSSLIM